LPESPEQQAIGLIMDVSSHEFFHIVTPLNMCSREVREFNFNKTVLSKHLWLYEGSTEYDAHHTQVTQGLITPEEYLGRLSKKILISRKHFNDTLPFTALSLGCADKYEAQYVNVYQKGALIGACLDIYLNKLSGGNYGLKDLKHDLAVRYGPTNYFNDNELFDEITKLSFPEVRSFFAKYVEGNEALPYETFFGMAGVKYMPKKETTGFTMGGFSVTPNGEGALAIKSVAKLNEFGKKMGYQKDDELVSVNNELIVPEKFAGLSGRFIASLKEGDTVTVQVKRKNAKGEKETIALTAPAMKLTKTEEHVLEFETANDEQMKIRNAWLNLPCSK
jgi:predicted metalloprotease with PDZ domain